uniref:Uncharacterized protein n=1 Tax=Anguilla anguilla TaxID=7936 RepID=A0A0E9WEH7_ANGAN
MVFCWICCCLCYSDQYYMLFF